jgi:uncharacterized phage-associated protein
LTVSAGAALNKSGGPMPYSSLAIGNEFIRRTLQSGGTITHMQTQKLVYLSHGFNLSLNDSPLINDPVEAWEYGPVIRKLYDALKRYGKHQISRVIYWGDDTPLTVQPHTEALVSLSNTEAAIVHDIWTTYGKIPAFKLSSLTHQDDTPWRTIYEEARNAIIPDDLIKQYFRQIS